MLAPFASPAVDLPTLHCLAALADQEADDGIYTGQWVPSATRDYELTFQNADKLTVKILSHYKSYSEPYSYRGYKVWLAETHGAAGAIIYSDPQDDGYAQGDAYPDGPLGPPSHVQLGSIVYDWLGPGEPFTFHWERGGGTWKEGTVRDRQLPKIPSIPIQIRANRSPTRLRAVALILRSSGKA